jgi:two-component system invasion response regulator UvrY
MKILLVDDHAVVREGAKRLLASTFDACIIEAATSDEALAANTVHSPRLVVLDLNLPGAGGLDVLGRLKRDTPEARVLIFSMHATPTYVLRAMEAGANGFVSKAASATEFLEAARKILGGASYIQRDLLAEIGAGSLLAKGRQRPLTNRELDILRLMAEGQSLSEIASSLNVSYKTIANTCTLIKEKLLVERTSDLIRFAIELHSA